MLERLAYIVGIFVVVVLAIAIFKAMVESTAKRDATKRLDRCRAEEQKARLLLTDATLQVIEEHRASLERVYARSVHRDDYGNLVMDKWEDEIEYFIDSTLLPRVAQSPQAEAYGGKLLALLSARNDFNAANGAHNEHIAELGPDNIIAAMRANCAAVLRSSIEVDDLQNLPVDIADADGTSFELACVNVLDSNGWTVNRNGGSGDQGVDIIACLRGRRIAIQCKNYAAAVGTAAVQEVYTGIAVHNCHAGVVVSRKGFTIGALKAARQTGVLLINFDELGQLASHLEIR